MFNFNELFVWGYLCVKFGLFKVFEKCCMIFIMIIM